MNTKEFSELLRKAEELAKGRSRGRSPFGRLTPHPSEISRPVLPMQPRESEGWDEGLAGIRAWKEAVRTGVPPKEFSELTDTEKAVWRHYYKGAKKTLRQTKGQSGGGLEGYLPGDRMASKFGLLWRGTNKAEVEHLATQGRFKSKWENANFPGKARTYIAGGTAVPEKYALSNSANASSKGPWTVRMKRSVDKGTSGAALLPADIHDSGARIYGIAPHVLRRSDNKIRGYVGNYASTAPIKGGIKKNEVRVLLKMKGTKKSEGRYGTTESPLWAATPLGDIQKKNFSSLTHPTLGMALKNFQLPHDSATQPDSSERREFIKTGILGAGIAAGAGIGAGSDWFVRR